MSGSAMGSTGPRTPRSPPCPARTCSLSQAALVSPLTRAISPSGPDEDQHGDDRRTGLAERGRIDLHRGHRIEALEERVDAAHEAHHGLAFGHARGTPRAPLRRRPRRRSPAGRPRPGSGRPGAVRSRSVGDRLRGVRSVTVCAQRRTGLRLPGVHLLAQPLPLPRPAAASPAASGAGLRRGRAARPAPAVRARS